MSALDRFAAIGSIGGWLTLNLALNVRGGLHARRGQTRCSALSVPDYSVFVLQTPSLSAQTESVALQFFNKWLMTNTGFKFPLFYTMFHMIAG
jgi:hypothetical protein